MMSGKILMRRVLVSCIAAGLALITGVSAAGQERKPGDAPAAVTTGPATDAATAPVAIVKKGTDGTFTGYYQDTDLRVVLRQLSMLSRKNIIATKAVSGRVTATLYDVTFDEALESVLKSSGFVYRTKENFVYVYTPTELAAVLKAEKPKEVRTFYLSYITAADAKTLIAPAMSADGTIAVTPVTEVGVAPNAEASGGNTYATADILVVNDYKENLDRVAAILKEIDVKADQVLIEATILSAELNDRTRLGVNFNILSNTDFFSQGTMDGMTNPVTGALSVDPPAAADLSHASMYRTAFTPVIAGGFSFVTITDKIAAFVRALETINDVTILANPKLMVVNKQKGEILIGSRDGYFTQTISDGVVTQSVEYLETGTKLVVRPFIGRDGYVRLEIHSEDSNGGVVGGLPAEDTTETTTNVLIRDGHTLIMGGLFRENTTNDRRQVPVLGNIPLVGVLFRDTNDSTNRNEVIILVTPHIVEQEVAEAVGEDLKDDVERHRVGARKGLKWFAAGRISRAHMAWAREHMKAGRTLQAQWEVTAALAVDPRLMEAIKLRERLSEKAYWADEARYSSVKYALQKMLMKKLGKDVREIIPPDRPAKLERMDPDIRKALGIMETRRPPKKTAPPAPRTQPAPGAGKKPGPAAKK